VTIGCYKILSSGYLVPLPRNKICEKFKVTHLLVLMNHGEILSSHDVSGKNSFHSFALARQKANWLNIDSTSSGSFTCRWEPHVTMQLE
jgi:hypothetical protein